MKSQWQTIPVTDSEPMQIYVARPEGAGPFPAVLVLQEVFGVNGHIREVAERLAVEGYVALAPELFHRTAPPGFAPPYSEMAQVRVHAAALSVETLSADILASFTFFERDPSVDLQKVAAIGFCLGGRAAFLANTILPLRAAVSFYGSKISTLRDRLQEVSGPTLLVWGGADPHITLAERDETRQMLRQGNKVFVDAEFGPATHGFFCPDRDSFHPASARQAWALTAQFLRDGFAN